MYLMIENQNECPIEGFTTLGLSTARDNADSIGQFGSGNKHAVLLCMRNSINPIIYSGKTKIQFYSKPSQMGEKSYNKVFIKIGTKKAKESNFCLEYGELDWNSLDMGLREFVSNAIDNGGFDPLLASVVEQPRAKMGTTRIFVPLTHEVQQFYSTIQDRFLHYTGKQNGKIIPKSKEGNARIYRKGVFVSEINKHSLFDYNLDDSVKINECRVMDEYSAKMQAGKLVARDLQAIKTILKSFNDGKEYLEHTFSKYDLMYGDKRIWQKAWKDIYGDAVCCSSPMFTSILERKGFTCQIILNEGWRSTLEFYDIPNEGAKLVDVEQKGQEIVPTSTSAQDTLDTVWEWLTDVSMTQSKTKPLISCFSKMVDGSSTLKGYYQNGTVFINIENDTDRQTMLEELAHYITGATDNSRDFQEFAFLFGKRMAEVIYE